MFKVDEESEFDAKTKQSENESIMMHQSKDNENYSQKIQKIGPDGMPFNSLYNRLQDNTEKQQRFREKRMSVWKQNLIDFNMMLPKEHIKDTERNISHIMRKGITKSKSSSIGDVITFQRVNPMAGSDG